LVGQVFWEEEQEDPGLFIGVSVFFQKSDQNFLNLFLLFSYFVDGVKPKISFPSDAYGVFHSYSHTQTLYKGIIVMQDMCYSQTAWSLTVRRFCMTVTSPLSNIHTIASDSQKVLQKFSYTFRRFCHSLQIHYRSGESVDTVDQGQSGRVKILGACVDEESQSAFGRFEGDAGDRDSGDGAG
jgi:hypothetical protein